MQSRAELVTMDFTYAKSPLFVRQTVAAAFGLPLDQEFTWEILKNLVCSLDHVLLPKHLVVNGFARMGVSFPDEAEMLRKFVKELCKYKPDVVVEFVIH